MRNAAKKVVHGTKNAARKAGSIAKKVHSKVTDFFRKPSKVKTHKKMKESRTSIKKRPGNDEAVKGTVTVCRFF